MLGFPLETSWKCCKLWHFKMLKKMSLALKSYIRLTNLFIPDFFFSLPICHYTSYSIGNKEHSFLHFCSLGFLHNKYFTWQRSPFHTVFPRASAWSELLIPAGNFNQMQSAGWFVCVRVCVNVVCTWQK